MSGLDILNILQSIQDPNKKSGSNDKDSESMSNTSSNQHERKYIPPSHSQDHHNIFKVMNEVNIPVPELDLDYKPKGFEHSYSIRDAYECKQGALSNSLLIKFMRDNIPNKDFFALDPSLYQEPHSRRTNNNGRNAKNKKFQNKRKGSEYPSGNASGSSNRRGQASGGHRNQIEDKPETTLEETFEMMKIEKEIASTGNKMQDFELFKQMMRGENPNGNDRGADDQGPPGLTGMFATSNMDEDTFQELEPEGEEESDNEAFEEPATQKASKYASFFNEDEQEEAQEVHQPSVQDSNNSSRSKMLDFLRVQEEKTNSNTSDQSSNVITPRQPMNNPAFNQQQVPQQQVPPQQQQQMNPLQGNMPPYQMMMPPGQQMNYPQGNGQQHPNMNNRMQMPFNGHPQQMNPYMYGAPMGMPPQQTNGQQRQMPNMPQQRQMQQQPNGPQMPMPNMQQMPNRQQMPQQQMPPGFMQGMPFGNMPGNGENRNVQQMPIPPFMDPNFRMLPPDQQMRIMQQFQQSMNKH